jgi:hypothetical protein
VAAFNAAQERMANARRASTADRESKKRKVAPPMIQCHRCGNTGHKARDCSATATSAASMVGVAHKPRTGTDDNALAARAMMTQRLESSHQPHLAKAELRPSSHGSSGAESYSLSRYSRRAATTPLRRRSRSLDRRVDSLRADFLAQVRQQLHAVGEQRLNHYMDKMAAQQR